MWCFSDDIKSGLHYYRQTPVQRKLDTIFSGSLKDGEEDPTSVFERCKVESIARLMLMNVYNPEKQNVHKFDDLLLVADTALQSIRCVPNFSYLWRSPRKTFLIYK